MVNWSKWSEFTFFSNNGFTITWGDVANWFMALPLYEQILIAVGITAILVLIGVGIYYLIKGIAYLIYYVLKGVAYLLYYMLKGLYYLFYGLFLGLYKLFEGLYYLISGKPRPKKQEQQPTPRIEEPIKTKTPIPRKIIQNIPEKIAFCGECGAKFTDSMSQHLSDKGLAFCIHCGAGFKFNSVNIES